MEILANLIARGGGVIVTSNPVRWPIHLATSHDDESNCHCTCGALTPRSRRLAVEPDHPAGSGCFAVGRSTSCSHRATRASRLWRSLGDRTISAFLINS